MWRFLIAPLAIVLLAGCNVQQAPKASSPGRSCANILMKALANAEATPGIWSCLAPEVQAQATIKDDRVLAGPTDITATRYLATKGNEVEYEIDRKDHPAEKWVVTLTAQGKVHSLRRIG